MASESLAVDVAVVGAGPAGAATALSLAHRGASVVIIDRGTARPLLGESLPPSAAPVLGDLGLWADPEVRGHRPSFGNRSSWGSALPGETDFIRSPNGAGWHLDRPRFDHQLRAAIIAAGIPILSETRVRSCVTGDVRRWSLSLWNGTVEGRVEADIVVDATGRSRQITRMLGVPRLVYDRLIGAIGLFSTASETVETDSFTDLEAVEDGWWYASPLPDGRLVAGYMTDADSDTGSMTRTPAGWTRLLCQTIRLRERVRSGGYTLSDAMHIVAADSSRLVAAAGPGWYAVGDAAAAYDPLSSQGIVSALEGGRRAAQALAAGDAHGVVEYQQFVDDVYTRYLSHWLGYYALEQRWPSSAFWRRRHAALTSVLES